MIEIRAGRHDEFRWSGDTRAKYLSICFSDRWEEHKIAIYGGYC